MYLQVVQCRLLRLRYSDANALFYELRLSSRNGTLGRERTVPLCILNVQHFCNQVHLNQAIEVMYVLVSITSKYMNCC